jgi:adenylosuccinate lyase
VTTVADEHASIRLASGLDLPRLLASQQGASIAYHRGEAEVDDRNAVLRAPVDVLLLAACEDAMTEEEATVLPARAVVVGANDGLHPRVEALLHRRGVLVVPDFIGGAGGSASMDALFAPARRPDAATVLEQSGEVVAGLAGRMLAMSSSEDKAPREAGLALAEVARPAPDSKPYGLRTLRPVDGSGPTAQSHGVAAPDASGIEGRCQHERGHIVDSRFYGHVYATEKSRAIFCDVCRFQRWLDVEAALALSQAELDLVPQAQAERIAEAARVERLDLDRVRDEVRRTRHSLVGLLSAVQEACPGDAGQFIHYGATTQDIQDTGQVLEMRDVLCQAELDLFEIVGTLVDTARQHAETLVVGRTHAQPALPMTFGLKVAGWLDELLREVGRLEEMKPRVLVAQLFGGVGTMAGFGDEGPVLLERFARRLGLGVPEIGWHVSRDRVVEYVTTLAMVSATLARIANELRTLSRPELAELELAWHPGKVGSSTMPHKRNPEECEQVMVLARLAAAQVETALGGMLMEHERDSRGLRLEWAIVADVSHYTLAALAIAKDLLAGFDVYPERMAANASVAADAVCTEALMLALARGVGKQSAHALVYELTQAATSEGGELRAYLLNSSEVRRHLSAEELERIFDPGSYLGTASRLTHEVIATAEHWLGSREQRP